MDDILASIRKIISEDPASLGLGAPAAPSSAPLSMDAHRAPVAAGLDERQRPAGTPAAAPVSHPAVGGSDDLSDLIEAGTSPAAPSPAAPAPAAGAPLGASLGALAAGLATLIKSPPTQPAPAPTADAPPAPIAPPPAAVNETAALPKADADAMPNAEVAPSSPQPSAPPAGRTLEETVAEMLRPMLQRWVAENLPALAERIVREQVRRNSGDV